MRLDAVTLTLVSTPIIALQGVLLLYSWNQSRESRALAWWGASLILAATGLALVLARGAIPLWISISAGNATVLLAVALFWSGFRIFERRRVRLPWMLAGPTLWLAACGVPAVYKTFELRLALASALVTAYLLAAASEVWRGRAERLGSRCPIIVILGIHMAFTISRSFMGGAFRTGSQAGAAPPSSMAVMAYESLVFAIVASFLVLNLTKERIEAEQRAIAACDPLTGTLNRRAFLERAREMLDRTRRARQSCALIVADLDLFKSVNDRFGHAAGDRVLQGLAHVASEHLPGGSLMVRLGGEEFAFLLAGNQAGAGPIAERLRAGLEATRFETQHEAFSVTVSIGIATTEDVGHVLDAMMAAADVALYRAKALGRNRVEATGLPEPEPAEAGELTEYERLALAA